MCVCLRVCACHHLFPSLASLYISPYYISVSLSLSLSLSLSVSPRLIVSTSHCLSPSLSLFLSVSVIVCVSGFECGIWYLFRYVIPFVCVRACVCVCLSLCVCVLVPECPSAVVFLFGWAFTAWVTTRSLGHYDTMDYVSVYVYV